MIATLRNRGTLLVLAFIVNLCIAQTMPATDLPPELTKWMTAIVQHESGNKPWAIMNNTYFRENRKGASTIFNTRDKAEEYAGKFVGMGHDLDLGLYQLNWKYQKNRAGVTLSNIFDPYVQEQIGKAVLKEFYAKAKKTYGPGELAERRAVSAYNNGNIYADNQKYLAGIYRVLGKSVAGLKGSDSGPSATAAGEAAKDGIVKDRASKDPTANTNVPGEVNPVDGSPLNPGETSSEQAASDSEDISIGSIFAVLGIIALVVAGLVFGGKALALAFGGMKYRAANAVFNFGKNAADDAASKLG